MKGFTNEGTSTQPHMAKAAYLRQRGDHVTQTLKINHLAILKIK